MEIDVYELEGHSNFTYQNYLGQDFECLGYACYADITYKINAVKDIKIYFNPDKMNIDWADYCVNHSHFKDAFPNKDVTHQLEEGFEISSECPNNLASFAMSALRMCVHFGLSPFIEKIQEDFNASMEEIFVLSHFYTLNNEKYILNNGNSNHLPLQKCKEGVVGYKYNKKNLNNVGFNVRGISGGDINRLFYKNNNKTLPKIDDSNYSEEYDKLFNIKYQKTVDQKENVKGFLEWYRNV